MLTVVSLWRHSISIRIPAIIYNTGDHAISLVWSSFFFESSSQGFPVCHPEALTPVADSSERSIERLEIRDVADVKAKAPEGSKKNRSIIFPCWGVINQALG